MANQQGIIVQSVERAFEILDVIGNSNENELALSEISAITNLNKSTAYGLVNTMVSKGYLEQNPSTKRYRLGIKLFEMGSTMINRLDVREEAKPFLKMLSEKYRSTVHLAQLYDHEVVYIDKVDSPEVFVQYSQLGRRAPLYCTGVGKAILANLSKEKREKYYDWVDFVPFTPTTITTIKDLEGELRKVKRQGYAIDDQEMQMGLKCVASPVLDHRGEPVVAISVSKSINNLAEELTQAIAGDVVGIAQQLSRRLGYQQPLAKDRNVRS